MYLIVQSEHCSKLLLKRYLTTDNSWMPYKFKAQYFLSYAEAATNMLLVQTDALKDMIEIIFESIESL